MTGIVIARIIARLNIGGPAVHVCNLMAGLDPARFEQHLIVGRPGPHEGDMAYLIAEKGIAPPTIIPELGRRLAPVRDLRAVLKLVSVLRRQRPHIVETHTAKAGFVGRVAARLAGVPLVLHVFHGHVFYGYFGPLQTRLFIGIERLLARLSDRIITVSPAQRHDIVHTYRIAPPEKVLVVPLGLDLRPFAAAKQTLGGCPFGGRKPVYNFRAALGVPADAPLVGFVGRLTSVKRPALFVEVARRVLTRLPGAHFVMVGDGELRPAVERQIAELSMTGRVTLAGWQRNMPPVYAALDVLALTSLNEGTPVTAIEALAAGTPVVATSVGGVPDVLTDGHSGLLVPSGDADAMAQAIVGLLQVPERGEALACQGQREVLARYGIERLVQDMESLYVALLEEKGVRLS